MSTGSKQKLHKYTRGDLTQQQLIGNRPVTLNRQA